LSTLLRGKEVEIGYMGKLSSYANDLELRNQAFKLIGDFILKDGDREFIKESGTGLHLFMSRYWQGQMGVTLGQAASVALAGQIHGEATRGVSLAGAW
jgi:hypothetical protein